MNLKKKYQIEREFHDRWAKTIVIKKINYRGAFESPTAIENSYALSRMWPIKNKIILDLGCGMGDASLYLASKGAKVHAVDISPGMIEVLKKSSKETKLSHNIQAKVMLAEKLDFPNETFHFVFGNGLLHHVEIDRSLKEVCRVLKPGGVAIFIEPLAHNPIINIYRKIANQVRTPTETPLNYSRLNRLTKAKFKYTSHKEFHLLTLLIFSWFYFINRANPNQERYWKKIIDEGSKVEIGFKILKAGDSIILKILPVLKRYCWNTVLVFQK